MVSECLEGALEILLEYTWADDFLTFLSLWASLSVVLTHVLIICCTESNDTLLSFVAHIDTYKHGLLRYLRPKVETPQVSSKLSIDLSQDVDIDSIVVLLDGLARDELWNNWTVCVDLVFQSCVEVLLLDRVWHDDQEEVQVLGLFGFSKLSTICIFAADVLEIVVIDGFLKVLNSWLVAKFDNISIVDINVESSLVGELIESIVKILTVRNIFLETEDGPLSEGNRLVHDCTQDLCVVQWSRCGGSLVILVGALLEYLRSF